MSPIKILSMTPGTVTALAAIFGSFVGALGSSISTWIIQRHQDRRDLLGRKIFHREQLYSDFVSESARILVDALEHNVSDPKNLDLTGDFCTRRSEREPLTRRKAGHVRRSGTV